MIDELKLKFGKYRGKMLKDIPEDYLKWAVDSGAFKGKILVYAKTKLDYPKTDFKITVEDAVVGNGEYIVQAHTKNQALKVLRKTHHIQCTQSFYGTTFTVEPLN